MHAGDLCAIVKKRLRRFSAAQTVMKEFIHCFFGNSEQVGFTNFSPGHFLPILLAVNLLFFLACLPWLRKDQKAQKAI